MKQDQLKYCLYLGLTRSFSDLYCYGNTVTNSSYNATSIDFRLTFGIFLISCFIAWFSRYILMFIVFKISGFSPRRIWVLLKVITRGCAVYGNLLFRTMLSEWHQITRFFSPIFLLFSILENSSDHFPKISVFRYESERFLENSSMTISFSL